MAPSKQSTQSRQDAKAQRIKAVAVSFATLRLSDFAFNPLQSTPKIRDTDKHEFEQVDPLLDGIAEDVGNLIDGDALAMLKTKLSQILGESCSVTLDINVNVFDSGREESLPLLQTGLSTSNGSGKDREYQTSKYKNHASTSASNGCRLCHSGRMFWLQVDNVSEGHSRAVY